MLAALSSRPHHRQRKIAMPSVTEHKTFSGQCFCGAVRWQGKGAVIWAGHCHCDSRRRACSAVFSSWIGLPRQSVTWQGASQLYRSAADFERGFCSRRGMPLFYESARRPLETDFCAVSLDHPEKFVPPAHYHYAECQSWIIVSEGLPKYRAGNETPADRM